MTKENYRPQNKTILKVIEYLEQELGLCVYGQNTNLETGQEFPSHRDFDPEDIIKYRNLIESDGLWRDEDE